MRYIFFILSIVFCAKLAAQENDIQKNGYKYVGKDVQDND